MRISGLYYITADGEGAPEHQEQVTMACRGGATWVQLRRKNASVAGVEAAARETLPICKRYGARLIINDHPDVALAVQAAGVHLGKKDLSPAAARKLLGPEFLIGGTANTFGDIVRLAAEGVDYIGLGPFRFTTTKQDLDPELGREGIRLVVHRMTVAGIGLPVFAIGGIRPEDVAGLMEAGVSGIAVSSAIARAGDISEAARTFIRELNYATSHEQADHSR